MDVFVAATGDINYHHLVFVHRGCKLDRIGDCVSGFQRWHDALNERQHTKCFERLIIGYRHIVSPPDILQPAMLWPYSRVIQPGTDGMGAGDLPVIVFHQVGAVAVEYSRATSTQRRSMLTGFNAMTAGFNAI